MAQYTLVYGSPECFLSSKAWRDILSDTDFTAKLVGVAIDEAHCIVQWYVISLINCLHIDGLHLTSWRPCWRYNTKKYVINSIVRSSRRGWLTLSATSREIDLQTKNIMLKLIVYLFLLGDCLVLKKVPFKKWFGCLGEIKSLIPNNVRFVIVTGTATVATRAEIIESLQ